MNVVIYTQELEPITVIDLPLWLLDDIEKYGRVRIATGIKGEDSSKQGTVDVYCTKVKWLDGTLKPILVTPDEEMFLKAQPSWLPGQHSVVSGYKKAVKDLTQKLIKAMRK